MFVIPGTNHFRELREDADTRGNLRRRIEEHPADVFSCIVAVEETIKGVKTDCRLGVRAPTSLGDCVKIHLASLRSMMRAAWMKIMASLEVVLVS